MNDKTFVDTNVLIYAYDVDANVKHELAKAALRDLWDKREGVLRMQVLQEFYVNCTRKIAKPIPGSVAQLVVSLYSGWCVETTPAEIASAFRVEEEARISFWDALIVASAAKTGAMSILSENMNGRQVIAGFASTIPLFDEK